MTETRLEKQPARRFDSTRLLSILLRPRQTFEMIKGEARASWLTPLLVISLTALLAVIANGYVLTNFSIASEVPLPPDWEFWSPEQQDQFMQAQQLTQGPLVTYILPLLMSWAKLWVGWIVLGGLLHLVSTLLGGRGTMQSALNITAWAILPLALRDGLRVVYVLTARHIILSPGLSGFATSPFWSQFLQHTDLFMVWSIALLILGFMIVDGLPRGKAIFGVILVVLLLISAQAGVGTLISGFGGAATSSGAF